MKESMKQRMKYKNHFTIIRVFVVVIGVVTGGILYLANQGPDQTPSEVVQAWINVYPADLTKAAPLTTPAMRQGLSLDDWVKHSQATLGDFRYVEGQVVSENVNGNQAEVLLDVEISSSLGKQLQREQYRLTLLDKNWAIEERAVVLVLPSPPPFS